MDEKIAFLALVTAIIGLLILTYASEKISPPRAEIKHITQSDVGRNVRVSGHATDVHEFSGGSAVFTLQEDNSTITVYLPYAVANEIDPATYEGEAVDLTGTVQVYGGRLEIIIEDYQDLKILP